MLPTNEKANKNTIFKSPLNGNIFIAESNKHVEDCITFSYEAQHLYILSDDEIKVDDYMIKLGIGVNKALFLEQSAGVFDGYMHHKNSEGNDYYWKYKKVIASTDPSLNLPSPSKTFIQKYCDKGGIDEIMVEYVNGVLHGEMLKIKNNTITIKPIPQATFNRIQVIALLDSYKTSGLSLEEFVENNL